MNILLITLAFVLVAILSPFGIIYNLLFNWKTRKEYFFNIAVSLDQLGNTICAGLLNLVMTKGEYIKFGHTDETVSGVLGKNKANGTLTVTGMRLCNFLNKIDKNHVEDAIELDEEEM